MPKKPSGIALRMPRGRPLSNGNGGSPRPAFVALSIDIAANVYDLLVAAAARRPAASPLHDELAEDAPRMTVPQIVAEIASGVVLRGSISHALNLFASYRADQRGIFGKYGAKRREEEQSSGIEPEADAP